MLENNPADTHPIKASQLPENLISAWREARIMAGQPAAAALISPHHLAAETMARLFGVDKDALSMSLQTSALAIHGGSLEGLEGTLSSQASTLNSLFHRLTQFAFSEPRTVEEFSAYMRLALRAQSQSTDAMETLANLKLGPKVLFTKQFNAAHQQVVNNHHSESASSSKPRKPRIVRSAKSRAGARRSSASLPAPSAIAASPPSLPTPYDHAPLDTRIPGESTPVHSPLAAMEPIDRPQKRRG